MRSLPNRRHQGVTRLTLAFLTTATLAAVPLTASAAGRPERQFTQPAALPAAVGPLPSALVPATKFEIDGDITVGAGGDWDSPTVDNAPPLANTVLYGPYTTSAGNKSAGIVSYANAEDGCVGDGTGFPGSQTQNSDPWAPGAAGPNKKDDLCRGGAAIEIVEVNGAYNYIMYSYWARHPKATGELSVFTVLQGSKPGRSDDRLVSFDYKPSTDEFTVDILKWSGTAWVDDPSITLGSGVYSYGIGKNLWASTGGNADANDATFAEVAINLTATGVLADDSCQEFSAASSISRTGNSAQAQLQDYLAFSSPVSIKSCGNLVVRKATLPTGTLGGPFQYVVTQAAQEPGSAVHDDTMRIDGNGPNDPGPDTPGEGDDDTSYNSITETLTVDTDSTDSITGVISAPDYRIRETLTAPQMPAGWTMDSVSCTYYDPFEPVVANRTKTVLIAKDGAYIPGATFQIPSNTVDPDRSSCTITNATSTITVRKEGAGDGAADFGLTFNPARTVAPISLGETTKPVQFTPGTAVTITESMPTTGLPWVSYGATCVNDDTGAVVASSTTASVSVTSVKAVNITCTYTNQQQARIRVTKNFSPNPIAPAAPKATFTWANMASSTPAASTDTLADEASSTWYVVAPNTGLVTGATAGGDYSVTETPVAGFNSAGYTCTDGSQSTGLTATYNVAPGQSLDCTFLNVAKGTVTIVKNAVPDGAISFPFTTTGGLPDDSFELIDDGSDSRQVQWQGVAAGQYTVTEDTSAHPGWELTAITCSDAEGTTSSGDIDSGVATINVDADDTVVCTFTNTRRTATLTLDKRWIDAAAGSRVNLKVSEPVVGGVASGSSTATDAVATAPGSPGTTTPAQLTIYANSTVELSETFVVDGEHYTSALSCDGGRSTAGLTGTYVVGNTPSDVTCTFTNTGRTATLVLTKTWNGSPAGEGGAVDLFIENGVLPGDRGRNSNDGVDNDDDAVAEVLVGHAVDLRELFTDGNQDQYIKSLSCSVPDGENGTIDIPVSYNNINVFGTVIVDPDFADQTVTCTFNNHRRSALVTMFKGWGFGAPGDTAEIYINGINNGSATSTAPTGYHPTFFDIDHSFQMEIYAGERISFGENLGSANVGLYQSSISCRNEGYKLDANGSPVIDENGNYVVSPFTGTVVLSVALPTPAGYVVPNYQVPDTLSTLGQDIDEDGVIEVFCVVANARTTADFTLRKNWVDGVTGDSADLLAVGMQSKSTATATSPAASTPNPYLDTTNVAQPMTLSGGRVYIRETVTAATTAYVADQPVCVYTPLDGSAAQTLTPVAATDADATAAGLTGAARSGDYVVALPRVSGAPVTCTYTNRAPRWTLTKTANPTSSTQVDRGQVVTYTVTVRNTGTVPVRGIAVRDDLTEVLARAELLTSSYVASQGTAAASGSALVWTVGDVAAGATATLTYQVKVKATATGTLRNVVVSTGTVPPVTCNPCSTTHPVKDPSNPGTTVVGTTIPGVPTTLPPASNPPSTPYPVTSLPRTGGNVETTLLVAASLLIGGLLLVMIRRKQQRPVV